MLIKCNHPFLAIKPVRFRVVGAASEEQIVHLKNSEWHELSLNTVMENQQQYLFFEVDHTWNPRLQGYGDDPRDLGVALSLQSGNNN
jgi:hypothetical protein